MRERSWEDARPSARYGAQAMLMAFPFVCFTLALLTDLAFWRSSNLMWQNFSAWLLFAGLVFGGLALLVGLLRLASRRYRASISVAFVVGGMAVLALAFLNSLVHARDGWTAVVPSGLALSAVTVLLMAVVAWLGRARRVSFAQREVRHG